MIFNIGATGGSMKELNYAETIKKMVSGNSESGIFTIPKDGVIYATGRAYGATSSTQLFIGTTNTDLVEVFESYNIGTTTGLGHSPSAEFPVKAGTLYKLASAGNSNAFIMTHFIPYKD